jgi:quercetin dioxygenase-like cupin family protein
MPMAAATWWTAGGTCRTPECPTTEALLDKAHPNENGAPVSDRCCVHVTEIQWEEVFPDGTKSATLVGSREAGVQFTYAFFIPAGVWDAPHSHCADAHVYVMSGELRLGYGTRLDRPAARVFGVGSYVFVPAGDVHFDGAETDTIILGNAVGPWSTDYV